MTQKQQITSSTFLLHITLVLLSIFQTAQCGRILAESDKEATYIANAIAVIKDWTPEHKATKEVRAVETGFNVVASSIDQNGYLHNNPRLDG